MKDQFTHVLYDFILSFLWFDSHRIVFVVSAYYKIHSFTCILINKPTKKNRETNCRLYKYL